MDTYVILAGGYWTLSKKQDLGNYQVDAQDKGKATCDYLIKLVGIPDSFFEPVETKRRYDYFCKTCKRYVTETEYLEKKGCMSRPDHEIEEQFDDIPMYLPGIFDKYSIPKIKWMNPCFRIFVNHGKGVERWRDLWRYVTMTMPPSARIVPDLLPKAVGNKMQWLISEDEVPTIVFPGHEEEEPIMMPKRTESDSEGKPVVRRRK